MKLSDLKRPDLSSSEITETAIELLTLQKCRVRRVNNIPHNKRYRGQVQSGWSDIQGYSIDGRVVLCEVKKIGDKLSDAQKERLSDCVMCGGIALVATEVNGQVQLIEFKNYNGK